MKERIPSAAMAAYLLLCIVLGGSAQGVWGNLALQLLGIALLAFCAIVRRGRNEGALPTIPVALLLAGIVLILVQLIPLPPELWAKLPGRSTTAAGFNSLGFARPMLPISETPYDSAMTLIAAIPAISVFLATLVLRPGGRWIAAAVVGGSILGVLLGALQVADGNGSWAYLYRITNLGAVGFFANQNHMATLLLVAMPMTVALTVLTSSDRRSTLARYGTSVALLLLLLVGIVLNRSLAGFALVLPVLLASMSLLPAIAGWRRIVLPVALLAILAGTVLIATRPVSTGGISSEAAASAQSRQEIWATTASAINDSFPFGTGLGSFQHVYHQYEDPADATAEYVNHAHNDYLELVLELGLAGLLLTVLFFAWWAIAAIKLWRSHLSTSVGRAATIATAAILAHSLVDFPLRTAAISAIFAACVGVIAVQLREHRDATKGEMRTARHFKLG